MNIFWFYVRKSKANNVENEIKNYQAIFDYKPLYDKDFLKDWKNDATVAKTKIVEIYSKGLDVPVDKGLAQE